MRRERVLRSRGECRPRRDGTRRLSSITRSNGPSRARISPYSGVRPVSPLKKTRVRGGLHHQRRPQRLVAVVEAATREVLRGRGRERELGAGHAMRFPPVELDDALRRNAQGLQVRADAERRDDGHVLRRSSRMVVSRDDRSDRARGATASSGGSSRSRTGTGWNRFGPRKREGDARGPHTGSVSTRQPSISMQHRRVAEPGDTQSAVRGRYQLSSGFIDGSGPCGTRR